MILPGHFSLIKRSDTSTIFCVSTTTTATNTSTRSTHRKLILNNKSTTPSETSYLDTTINIGEGNGTARISVYDKREGFNFKIVNFPYLNSNIPRNPAYGVYISQLVRYGRICSRKDDFIYRHTDTDQGWIQKFQKGGAGIQILEKGGPDFDFSVHLSVIFL